ncbi:hypothetical protein [Bacillus atrophaeus]|nr:hypothetical protein [Bacillus atrophaeus]MED4806339.1 hypothetical protein [Bacillus atrophaeus]
MSLKPQIRMSPASPYEKSEFGSAAGWIPDAAGSYLQLLGY